MQNEYLYETHCHTLPVSKCAKVGVRETLEFYKALGYEGVFITNHFIDGNISCDKSLPYEEKINFYFSDYEEAVRIGEEIGISVFLGVELSYKGADFLIYGLDKSWYLAHPEIEEMSKKEELTLMAEDGALIVQAHPFREWKNIEFIRLCPRYVHAVETFNAHRSEFENKMAEHYARSYELVEFSGTDNHRGPADRLLGGMSSGCPIADEADFVRRIKNGKMTPFCIKLDEVQT